jgi:peptidoglycan/LPS O-acetylase OafA/YrhL
LRFYLSWFNLTSLIGLTPFNGPLWTVSVLIFIYAAFPFLLHRVKSVQNRLTWCLHNYWISVVSFAGLFYAGKALGSAIKCGSVDYFLARGFPLGRLPVFIMGCLLGVHHPHPRSMMDGARMLIQHTRCCRFRVLLAPRAWVPMNSHV